MTARERREEQLKGACSFADFLIKRTSQESIYDLLTVWRLEVLSYKRYDNTPKTHAELIANLDEAIAKQLPK